MNEPNAREFWIRKSNQTSRVYWTVRQKTGDYPPPAETTTSNWLYTEWFRVIEYTAVEKLERELAEYKGWMPTEPKPSENKLSSEVNRLLGECQRLQNLLDKARLSVYQAEKREENKLVAERAKSAALIEILTVADTYLTNGKEWTYGEYESVSRRVSEVLAKFKESK